MSTTRRQVLAAGTLALARPAAARAAQEQPRGDARVLVRLVALEQAAAFTYGTAGSSGILDDEAAATAFRFAGHEAAHARTLIGALEAAGGKAPAPPRGAADVDAVLRGLGDARTQPDLLRFAARLEGAALAAYHDAHRRIGDLWLLQTCTSIMANHGQHLTVLRSGLGADLLPTAFETGRGAVP